METRGVYRISRDTVYRHSGTMENNSRDKARVACSSIKTRKGRTMAGQMTVGKRIGVGFTVVIVITMVIGGLGVWNMRSATTDSMKLATEYVPEVKVATDLRGAANRVMYQMRGFGMTEEHKYYEAAQQEITAVRTHLDEAADLAKDAVYLKALEGQVHEASAAVGDYAKLMEDTETTITSMNGEREILDTNAASYMANCTEFIDGQNGAFSKDLEERQRKVAIVTDIVNMGTQVRVTNFKAQATNNMPLMRQAIDTLADLGEHTDALRPITRAADDIRRIDNTEVAAQDYAENMRAYIATNEALAKASSQMDAGAAAYMRNCTAFLADQNQKMQKEFGEDDANLEERLRKITLASEIIDTGNAVRVGNFKGQALQDPELIQNARLTLNGVTKIAENLRKITHQANNLAEIDNVEAAAQTYGEAMDEYLRNHIKLDEIRGQMDSAAGQYVTQCAEFLQGQQEKLTRDMHERHRKITLVNEIIALGNDARVKAFKSQALRSPEHMRNALANFPELDGKYAELRKITRLDADLKRIDNTKSSGNAYASALTSFLAEWTTLQSLGKQREAAGQRVIRACKTTADAGMTQTEQIATASAASLSTNSTIMIVGLAIGTLLAIACAIWIARSITGPLTRIITGMNEGADQVNDAAAQVSSASQQLAEGASEQASSLEETSSALEEMASMTRTNAENAKRANELSGQARDAAQSGDKTMHQLNDAMAGINDASGQISKIIKVIEEIAFQTNLLALNAAVEAARAGEHGKGFAVVADEVRNLAQRAAQAARETTGLIEGSVNKAKEGTDVAGEVGSALSGIVGDVTKVTELVDGITKASEEQAQGVDQVNTAVSQMDKVTQQNAAGAEESASAAEELSAQAATVKSMVDELAVMVNGASKQGAKATASRGKRFANPSPAPVHASMGRKGGTTLKAGDGSTNDEFMDMGDDGLSEF